MNTNAVPLITSDTPPEDVQLKNESVRLVGLDVRLYRFLAAAGRAHAIMFDVPLVVTCAVDNVEHKVGKHPIGKAVDLRASDIRGEWAQAFLLVITVLCDRFGCTVFDERNLPGAPHFHVEVAG